jgi:hypothetical protein
MWDKYDLADLAGAKFKTNMLILSTPAPAAFSDYEDTDSVFGPVGDTIPTLQQRTMPSSAAAASISSANI